MAVMYKDWQIHGLVFAITQIGQNLETRTSIDLGANFPNSPTHEFASVEWAPTHEIASDKRPYPHVFASDMP